MTSTRRGNLTQPRSIVRRGAQRMADLIAHCRLSVLRRAATPLILAAATAGSTVFAIEIKPGDIVVGTGSTTQYGVGRVYVVDPFAQTVTEIDTGGFYNGVGGLAIDGDFNIIVGAMANSSFGTGSIFRIDPLAESVSQIGSAAFYNGVGDLKLDANGDIIVGSLSATPTGQGGLYRVDPVSGLVSGIGSPFQYTGGVSALDIDSNGDFVVGTGVRSATGSGRLYTVSAAGTPTLVNLSDVYYNGVGSVLLEDDDSAIVGELASTGTGTGRLYRVDLATGTRTVLGSSDGYYNGVGALASDMDGTIWMGTAGSSALGFGQLFSVDPVTGAPTLIVSEQFQNGITAMEVVGPQIDFTGGYDVVIDDLNTLTMDGSPDWFSRAPDSVMDIDDLLTTLGTGAASVRAGTGNLNNQDGDVTLDINIDFAGLTGRSLTLRASDDLTLNGALTDSNGAAFDLALYAKNRRQWPTLANIASGDYNGQDGVLSINQVINTSGGDFTGYGYDFVNAAGATVTAGDIKLGIENNVTINAALTAPSIIIGGNTTVDDKATDTHAGHVDLNAALNATDITILATTIDNAGVPINIVGDLVMDMDGDTDLSANVNAANMTVTSNTLGAGNFVNDDANLTIVDRLSLDLAGSATLDNAVLTGSFDSTGINFTNQNDGTITVTLGDLDLTGHSGAISFNAAVNVQTGELMAAGDSFASTATVAAADDITLNFASSVDIANAVTAPNLTITTPDLATTGLGTLTIADAIVFNLGLTGDAVIDAAVQSSSLTSSGDAFTTGVNGTLTTTAAGVSGGNLDLSAHTGDVLLQANVAVAGDITVGTDVAPSTSFRNTATVTTTGATPGDVTLRQSGNVTLDGDLVRADTVDINTTSGDVAINQTVGTSQATRTVNTLTIVAQNLTTGTGGDLNIANSIDIQLNDATGDASLNAPVIAMDLTSNGRDFGTGTAAAVTLDAGDLNLSAHTGAVSFNSAVTVSAGSLTSGTSAEPATTFTTGAGGSLNVSGNVTLEHTGDVTTNADVDAANLNITTTDGSVTLNQSVGSQNTLQTLTVVADNFTTGNSTADLTVQGAIDLTLDNDALIQSATSADSITSEGSGFATGPNAPVTVTNDLNLSDHNGAVAFNALTTVGGNLTSGGGVRGRATTFDSGTGGQLAVTGDITLQHTGHVTTNADVDAANLNIDTTDGNVTMNQSVGSTGTLMDMTVIADTFTTADSSADITVQDAIDLTLDTDALIRSAVTADSLTSEGQGFATGANAPFDITNDLNLFDHNGAIAFNALTTVGGDLTSGGGLRGLATTFDTGTGGQLIITGDLTLLHRNNVAFNAPVDVTGTNGINITTGQGGDNGSVFINETFGTDNLTRSIASLTIAADNLTSNTAGDLNITGPINVDLDDITGDASLDAAVIASALTSDGRDFHTGAAAPMTLTGGNLDLSAHIGAISFDSLVDVTGNILSGTTAERATTFTTGTGGQIIATGDITLAHSSHVTTDADVDAANLNINTTDGNVTLNQSVGSQNTLQTLTVVADNYTTADTTADLTVQGAIDLTLDNDALVRSEVNAGSLTSEGRHFTTGVNAPVTTDTNLNLSDHNGAVAFNALTTVGGNLTSGGGVRGRATTFDTGVGGQLAVTGDITLQHTGHVTTNADVDAANLNINTTSGNVVMNQSVGSTGTLQSLTVVADNFTTADTAADLTVQGHTDLTLDQHALIQSPVQTGTLTSRGVNFTSTPHGTIDVNTGNMDLTGHTGVVTIGDDLTVHNGNFLTTGTDYFSEGVQTNVTGNMVMNHTGEVRFGDTTITGHLDLGPATNVIIDNPDYEPDTPGYVVKTNTIDTTGVQYLDINLNAVLDVTGEFYQADPTVVTLAGGTLRTSLLRTLGNIDTSFQFFFGEVNITNDLIINNLGAAERVLGRDPKVIAGQTLRVDDTTTLQEQFTIDGGIFITGRLINPQLLKFNSGTLGISETDLVIGTGGPFGRSYDLGYGKTLELVNGPSASSTGRIIVAADGVFQVSGGEASTEGGIQNSGILYMNSTLARLRGATLTNNSGGQIYGRGIIDTPLLNTAGGTVSATGSERLTFTNSSNTNHGSLTTFTGGTLDFNNGLTNTVDGIINSSAGIYNFGKVSSYSFPPFNANGGFLRNYGVVQVSGATAITGDTVAHSGSRVIASGRTSLSLFGDVYGLGGEYRAGTLNSEIIYFGVARGFVETTGDGEHLFEGGQDGLSPVLQGTFSGNGTWTASSAVNYVAVTVDVDGTNPMDTATKNEYLQTFDDALLDGRHSVFLYNRLTIKGNQKVVLKIWLDTDTPHSNPGSIYSIRPGDVFMPVQYNSLVWDLRGGLAPTFILPQLSNSAWSWETQWTDHALVLSVIPEPGTGLLLILPVAALVRRRRRRQDARQAA